jgi:DNA modification methylase
MNYRIIEGDCIDGMRRLEGQSVNCVVTSPPYFGLRDYGHDGQIGLEQTPDAYVAKLVAVFREVRRVLRDDGTLWLNLGDSYAGSWGNAGGHNRGSGTQREITVGSVVKDQADRNGDFVPPAANGYAELGIKKKDLIGIPWRVAFALQADGWYLRQDIIWHKPNPMPESVKDRCTKAHEYIFLLSKSERYHFDSEAMQEPASKGAAGSEFHTGKTGTHQLGRASTKPRTAGNKSHKYVDAYKASDTEEHRTKAGLMAVADTPWETRNRRSVWTVATRPYKGAHFATFPPDLIRPCILAGCPKDGTVLDPFGGSGTTAQVALEEGRKAVLCELNTDYIALAHKRLEGIKLRIA